MFEFYVNKFKKEKYLYPELQNYKLTNTRDTLS